MNKTELSKGLQRVFAEIREQGYITEQQMNYLKRRCNAEGKDIMDYSLIEEMGDGYGVPVTEEQGRKGLVWLYKQMCKRNKPTGYREDEIIKSSDASDFRFCGFYSQNGHSNFMPIYDLNGMEYVPFPEIYICG